MTKLNDTLDRMTAKGLRVDRTRLEMCISTYEINLALDLENIQSKTFPGLRPHAPKDMEKYFYEMMKHPIVKRTPKGKLSFNANVMEKLAKRHPVANDISAYRTKKKAGDSMRNLLKFTDAEGYAHPTFLPDKASTGRIAAKDPSVNNLIPQGRASVIPDEGNIFLYADYKSQELILMAFIADQPELKDLIYGEKDFHTSMAEILGTDRETAKMVVYATSYGATAKSLAWKLEKPESEILEVQQNYFKRFPKIATMLSDLAKKAKTDGFTETLGGNRYTVNLNNPDWDQEIRRAVNHPFQGTGADALKLVLPILDVRLGHLEGRVVTTVYDSILIEVPLENKEKAEELLVEVMCGAPEHEWDVEFRVTTNSGMSWSEAQGK